MALTLENQNLYNALFPNSQSSNQGGLFQTFNSGGFSNVLNTKSLDVTNTGGESGPNIGAGAIAGAAGNLAKMFDTNPNKYGNADILGDVASGVASGAAAGPWGMAIMGGVSLYKGLKQKQAQIDHDKKVKHNILRDAKAVSDKKEAHLSAQSFFAKQNSATAGAYGIGDIDNFLKQNRV